MSLISDALKRQEQLRSAPGAGAKRSEAAAATQPEVAVAAPPEVAAARPPETSRGAAAPNLAAPAAQPRAASPRPTSRSAAAPNPFLERERAAARRSNPSVLLMPILGIIVLLVLLFLRREFVPREEVEVEPQYAPRKVEETPAEPIFLSRDGGAHGEDASAGRMPALSGDASAGRMPALPGDASAGRMPALPGDGGETSNSLSASASSAALREKSAPPQPPQPPQPSNRQTVKPSNPSAEAVTQPTTWPAFTLTGIAVGRERLAILNTGEMLLAGETAKCGVKVEKVNASSVVFTWGGETKTLRKGEQSDKPAD